VNDEHPHSVAIGGFIIGALLIMLATLLFVLGSGLGAERTRVVMVFDSSVKGLSVGAPVALRGVVIGQVTGMNLILDSDTANLIMLVEADVSSANVESTQRASEEMIDHLITRGLRAQLNLQSILTGLLYIQLDFHPDTPALLVEIDSDYTQIPTIPTGLEKFTRRIQSLDLAQIAADVQSIAAGIDQFISQEEFRRLPQELGATLQGVQTLTTELQAAVTGASPGLERILASTDQLLNQASDALPALNTMLDQNLATLQAAATAFENTMNEIDGLVAPDSATTYQLNHALRELAMAGRALQLLAKTIEEQPESLLRGKSEETP